MSYSIRFGVKVAGAEDVFAVIGEPQYSSPTYNIRMILQKCMDWDFKQSRWYHMDFVIERVKYGINELTTNPHLYEQYEPDNGWGSVSSALKCLQSIYDYFYPENEWEREFDTDIPIECIYIRW